MTNLLDRFQKEELIEIILFVFIYGVAFIALYSSKVSDSILSMAGCVVIFTTVIALFMITGKAFK